MPTEIVEIAFCLPPGDRRKAHPRRAMLGTPGGAEPARAGSARSAPHPSGRTWRIRRGLQRQLVQMRAALDAGGSLPGHHEGRFWRIHGYGRSALLWRSTPRRKHGRLGREWGWARCRQSLGIGLARVRGRAVETVVRGCRAGHASFRRWIGPRRPCLVVNPGGGAGFMPATFQSK